MKVNSGNKVEAAKVRIGRMKDDRLEIVVVVDGHPEVIAKDVESLKVGELADAR